MRRSVELGRIQETALVPLYARALETRWKRPLFVDPKAVEIVSSIDWDFRRIAQRRRLAGCVLRGAIQEWGVGLQLVESRTVADVPESLWPRLSLPLRANLWFFGRLFPKAMNLYRLNLFVAR